MERIEETEFVHRFLENYDAREQPLLIQIGANEGKHEYAKVSGKDFVFEFMRDHPAWSGVLVEPIPEIFRQLRLNYHDHENNLLFFCCAVTEKVEYRSLSVTGKEGKTSSLIRKEATPSSKVIEVPCIPYSLLCDLAGVEQVHFLKVDTEGYDAIIVLSVLQSRFLPDFILWEKVRNDQVAIRSLERLGYKVYETGLSKRGSYMDRVAIRARLLIA